MEIPNNTLPMFSKWAKNAGKTIFSVPISDSKHAEVAFNNRSMNAFVIENKRLLSGKGFQLGDKNLYGVSVGEIFAYLHEMGADITKIAIAYRDAITNLTEKV